MIWSFELKGQQQTCEIRRDADGVYYEFVLTDSAGVEQVERFEDPSAVIARSVDHMRTLVEAGWRSSTGEPTLPR